MQLVVTDAIVNRRTSSAGIPQWSASVGKFTPTPRAAKKVPWFAFPSFDTLET
jgi:hypothetical protein